MPCGRIDIQGKTMVPDERRGKLRLCKDTDGLTHMQWGVRAPDMPFTPEEDLLVFPREAEMKFIPKPGVFVIKFPEDPSRNMFFWSQRSVDEAEKEGSDDELAAAAESSKRAAVAVSPLLASSSPRVAAPLLPAPLGCPVVSAATNRLVFSRHPSNARRAARCATARTNRSATRALRRNTRERFVSRSHA